MAQINYSFVSEKGTLFADGNLNVRTGAPSTKAGISKTVASGQSISYVGYVNDGEVITGNSKWYLSQDGDFFWSGGVKKTGTQASAGEFALGKILTGPLASLICTQRFGERPNVYKTYGSPGGHNGLDFRTILPENPADHKRNVFAVLSGTILEAKDDSLMGKLIRINHDNGYQSVYLHLDSYIVSPGQKVSAGSIIGVSGNTGSASEAPHLHFGFRPQNYNGNNGFMGYIDPTPYFKSTVEYVA
jgi:murein DD-endopeptidase MepM/ murein hydrolase activator NlpD